MHLSRQFDLKTLGISGLKKKMKRRKRTRLQSKLPTNLLPPNAGSVKLQKKMIVQKFLKKRKSRK